MKKKFNLFVGLSVIVLIASFYCRNESKRGCEMGNNFDEKSKKEITEIIKKINLSWIEGNPENLRNYFHQNMIIVSPELKVLGTGREECIKSYADFINQAKINEYNESEPEIYVFENTAIASYKYDIAWEMKGKSFKEPGHDLFVFIYTDNKWLAVWRKIIPIKKIN